MSLRSTVRSMLLSAALLSASVVHAAEPFQLEEASIESIHGAIRSGATTCQQGVEGYIARARAYNGICSKLVTADGAKAKAVPGTMRAGAPLKFPTQTLAIGKLAGRSSKKRRKTGNSVLTTGPRWVSSLSMRTTPTATPTCPERTARDADTSLLRFAVCCSGVTG